MDILLDTHALLWFIEGDNQLSKKSRLLIENKDNAVAISIASLFEIAIKLKINKLFLGKSFESIIEDIKLAQITILPITDEHILTYQNIPLFEHHKDPFDRLIIATAKAEHLVVISIDKNFAYYKDIIKVIW